jgi:hypothetical protein
MFVRFGNPEKITILQPGVAKAIRLPPSAFSLWCAGALKVYADKDINNLLDEANS